MTRYTTSNLIGFDRLFDLANRVPSPTEGYPKYDIIKLDDETTRLDLAIAGFSQDDIKISLEKNELKIEGELTSETDDSKKYVFSGIAKRSFVRKFTINDYVEVLNATIVNGILQITLKTIIPEEKKPKLIAIT